MRLLILGLLCIITVFIWSKLQKTEKFDTISNNNTTNYKDTCATPLVKRNKKHRKFFDSLTYDFPYLSKV